MIKTLMKSIREYKLPSILTLIFIMGEVLIEVAIPFITANLVNSIKNNAPISSVNNGTNACFNGANITRLRRYCGAYLR